MAISPQRVIDPIHFMFGSRVFGGCGCFRSNARWRPWHNMTLQEKDVDNSRLMSPFILATAILDFWRMSMSRDTGSDTIKAVGILLLYVLQKWRYAWSKNTPPQLLTNVTKMLPGQGCYTVPILFSYCLQPNGCVC